MRDHEADLLVVDLVLVGRRAGEQEDAEDVVAVALERRPRLVVVLGPVERAARSPISSSSRGALRAQLLVGRIEQVDPVRGHTAAIRR